MKTRGFWVRVAKSVGVAGLAFGLLLGAAIHGRGKRSSQTEAGQPQVAANQPSKISVPKADLDWRDAYGRLPLSFEENQGQTASKVRYLSRGSGYELFLTPQEAVLALHSQRSRKPSQHHGAAFLRSVRTESEARQPVAIRLQLEGANPSPQIGGAERLPARVNYFIGNDPEKWHTDVPSYARIKYAGVYPGVDLVFYGNQRRLEYDFIVDPGADPKAIRLKIDGAQRMRINSRGDLVLSVAQGEVELQKPMVYQNVNGIKREIASRYVVGSDHHVTFSIAKYDRSEPLVLDPVLNYSTYLGGSVGEAGAAIAIDGSGNAFIAGITSSLDFPTGSKGTGGTAPAGNVGVSFVAEIDPTGTQLLYSGYLAGTNSSVNDQAWGIAVDSGGKVYVTGQTYSTDFPTSSPNAGFKAGFNVSPNLTNAHGTSYLVKLDPTVNGTGSLLYSTYIGGTNGTQTVGDIGQSVAVDTNGIAYVAGYTDSTASTGVTSQINFPVVNGFQAALNSSSGNAFLAKIDTTKSGAASLLYSTYLGGTATNAANLLGFGDVAYGVAIDAASGNAYLAGVTTSTDFPTSGSVTALQPNVLAGNTQGTAFVTQIDTTKPVATQLVYSTYLGGAVFEQARGIVLGPNKVAYVTGTTNSNGFPTTPGAFDTSGAASGKAFVTLIDTAAPGGGAASKKYSTFLGGSGPTTGFGIQADSSGIAYVVGTTTSSDFPGATTLGAFQSKLPNAFGSPFIAKLDPGVSGTGALLYSTYFGGSGDPPTNDTDQGSAIAIDAANPPNAYITGSTFSADMPVFSSLPTGGSLKPPSDAFVAKFSLIPTLAIMPATGTTLDYGTVLIGTTSAAQTVTLTNNTAGNIAFTSAALSGTNAADYTVSTAGCSPNIVVGTPCVVSVKFTPTVVAPPSEIATLKITDGDSTSPQVFNLTGKGANPIPGVGLAPTSLAFGNQVLNTTSAAKTVTLTNTGTGALTIISIGASGDFAETSTGATACPISPATLAAGANCIISVTFTPTALGARAGTLTITDNAGGSPHTVPLTGTGTGVPGVGLAPTSLAFGNQALTTTSTAKPVTLTNTGTGALTITSIAASGDFAATSTGATACPISPATLAAGANCVISVTFTPTMLAARAGTLTITDNAANSPQTVSLTGTGTGTPDFGLTGPTAVQPVTLGQTLNFSVTVTGTGGFNSPVALACTGAPALATCTVTSPVTPPVAPPSTIQAQVSMTTTALVVPPQGIPTPTAPPRQVVPLVLALMMLFSLLWVRRPRLRLAMATAVLTLFAITGCNGLKHQSTPKGPATLTITGTSGALTHNVQVQISVN